MSLRAAERETGLSRRFLGEAVRKGELPCQRRGRALLVELDDLRTWWRQTAGPLTSEDREFVERRLQKEAGR